MAGIDPIMDCAVCFQTRVPRRRRDEGSEDQRGSGMTGIDPIMSGTLCSLNPRPLQLRAGKRIRRITDCA